MTKKQLTSKQLENVQRAIDSVTDCLSRADFEAIFRFSTATIQFLTGLESRIDRLMYAVDTANSKSEELSLIEDFTFEIIQRVVQLQEIADSNTPPIARINPRSLALTSVWVECKNTLASSK